MNIQKQYVGLMLLGLVLVGCGRQASDSSVKQDIQNNDFIESSIVDDQKLKDSIGLLIVNGVEMCQAFVTGEQEVTTAGHCLGGSNQATIIRFRTASGKTYDLTSKNINNNSDVATLRSAVSFPSYLEKNPGFFTSILQENRLLSVENNQLISKRNSSLFKIKGYEGITMHQYDTHKGHSGAPLLDENNRVIGIHIGAVFNENYNVIVDVNLFESSSLDVQKLFVLENFEALEEEIRRRQCYDKHCGDMKDLDDKLACDKICRDMAKNPPPGKD